MREADDEWLVRRAQAGYLDAFEELVVRHRNRVYAIALRLLLSPADAEDVAQDSLITAWQALPGFRGESRFSSWLYRIVVNKSRDAKRRQRPLVSMDPQEGSLEARLPLAPDAAGVVEGLERIAALRSAIAALPFELRAPLVLREFEGCSYADAADILGVTETTLRGRLARARQELVRQMRGWS